MSLTLARLDEIETAASKATPGPYSDGKTIPFRAWSCKKRGFSIAFVSGGQTEEEDANADYIAACDPQTVLALVRIAKAALLTAKWRQSEPHLELLADELREAGLL